LIPELLRMVVGPRASAAFFMAAKSSIFILIFNGR
jgi:hypothetical protein